jgi:hypothetical protein
LLNIDFSLNIGSCMTERVFNGTVNIANDENSFEMLYLRLECMFEASVIDRAIQQYNLYALRCEVS